MNNPTTTTHKPDTKNQETTGMTTLVFSADESLDELAAVYDTYVGGCVVFISVELYHQISIVSLGATDRFMACWSNPDLAKAMQSATLFCHIAGINFDYQMLDDNRFMFRLPVAA